MKMNGCVIPLTPIAVDLWKIRECPHARLFFLSHLHGDHIVGLTSSWQYPIYCTPITAEILKLRHNIRESLIRPLDLSVGHILYLDEEKTRTITVTLLDAKHCPGACMFLFQGYFGNILYTGDFRYDKGVTESSPLCDIAGNLDVIYLDNTYCLPACSFPSRQKCFDQIVDIIRKFPDYNVVIGLRSLGKEDLLVKIALELQEWIAISPKMFELVNILNLPQVFTTDPSQCRIRVEPFHIISNKNISAWNKKSPTIAILPTALYCGLNMSPFINQDKVFIVPYSDHSSYTELLNFVSYLRPCSIRPIVRANSRGPFGTSIAARADMTCFSKYLNKNLPVQKTCTLESVRTLTFSRPLGSLPQGKGGVKRRKSVKVSKSRIKKKGVIFEDSPDTSNMSEILKERSFGEESTSDMVEKTFDCDNSFTVKTIACVQENVVKIEIRPQNTQNPVSVISKVTSDTQESNQICDGTIENESDRNISCCSEETYPLRSEGVTSLSQSVDTHLHVNYNMSQENLKEDNSNRALFVDQCTFQSSVDLSCKSLESPDLSDESMRSYDSCRSLKCLNKNIEAVDADDDTNKFKTPFVDLSNYNSSSDSCDLATQDSSQVGESEFALARQVRISVQSGSESLKPQFTDYEIMDQVSPLQNPESQNQSNSKNFNLTCNIKKLAPKTFSEKINTNDLKSCTKDTKDVCFLTLKDTERMFLSKINDESDSHGNKNDCHDLRKASNCMTKSHNEISDSHSDSPNDTNKNLQDLKSHDTTDINGKFQDLNSDKPNDISDKFLNFISNSPNDTSNKFQDLKSNNPNKFEKSKAVDLPCELLEHELQIMSGQDQCESLGFEYNASLTESQITVPCDHHCHSHGFQYGFNANRSDRKEEIQPAGITSRSVECDSNKAAYISDAESTNKNCHCSCTDSRCSQIKAMGTSFQMHGVKKSTINSQFHSLKPKEETSTFKEPDLGLPFKEDSLDFDTSGSADDDDTNIIACTSHPNTSVTTQKVIENQAPSHLVKALEIGKISTVLFQASSDEQESQSSASSTNGINLNLSPLASFCTKGEVCRNAASSENRMQPTENRILKGDKIDKDYHMQQKRLLNLCTKENQKNRYIVFTNVNVKPLNRNTYRSGRGSFYRNAK